MQKKKSSDAPTGPDLVPLVVADVFQLAGAFRRWGDTIAGEADQTQARWQVLSAASSGNATVAQVARRLGLARQGIQRVADLLVADGLAELAWNRDNRRSPHLRLTAEGKNLLRKLTASASAFHKELAEGLNVEDLTTARIVLKKFRMQLDSDLNSDES